MDMDYRKQFSLQNVNPIMFHMWQNYTSFASSFREKNHFYTLKLETDHDQLNENI